MQISHADSSDRGRHKQTRYAFRLIPPAVIPLSRLHSAPPQTTPTCLASHPDDYVRLIGIAPQNKHRILETIIQRPE